MHIDELLRPHRRCLSEAKRSAYQYFAHTADLSALSVDVMVSAFKSYSALSRPPPIMYFQKLKWIIEAALAAHRPIS